MQLLRRTNRGDALSPFTRLQSEINRLFDDDWFGEDWDWSGFRGAYVPSVDVEETDDKMLVSCELPGVNKEDLDISVSGNQLTIRGEKKGETEEKSASFHRRERWYGSFSRSLALPEYVDPNKVDAHMKDGILTITVPKKEEVKPKQISIKG
jgi:HSP20 family protein